MEFTSCYLPSTDATSKRDKSAWSDKHLPPELDRLLGPGGSTELATSMLCVLSVCRAQVSYAGSSPCLRHSSSGFSIHCVCIVLSRPRPRQGHTAVRSQISTEHCIHYILYSIAKVAGRRRFPPPSVVNFDY